MNKRLFFVLLTVAIVLCCCSSVQADTNQSGPFSYSLKGNGTAIITGFNWNSVKDDDIYVPQLIDGYTVTEIGTGAFNWMYDFSSVPSHDQFFDWLDDSFYPIGFEQPGGIMIIPDYYSLEQEKKHFRYCFVGKPVNVILPNTITTISDYAFFCTQVSSVSIPSSVKTIGSGAFAGCINISQFSVDSSNSVFATIDGVLYNKQKKELVAVPMAKYGKYPVISNYITEERTVVPKMEEPFIIPEGIKSIGDFAFYGFALTAEKDGVVGIKIPDSVQHIGKYAFFRSFIGSTKTDYIINPDINNCPTLSFPCVTTIDDSSFEQAMVNCSLSFPDLTTIGDHAFDTSYIALNKDQTIFTLSAALTQVGKYSFYESSLARTADLNKSNSRNVVFDLSQTQLSEIPDYSFSLGYHYYQYSDLKGSLCTNQFTTILLPSALQRIGAHAFECNTIVSLTFPEDSHISTIDEFAFFGSHFYQDIISIPDGVVELGKECFFCDKLNSLYIPFSVTKIGDNVVDRSKTKLLVEEDSYAAMYASENGIPFSIFGSEDTSWLNE